MRQLYAVTLALLLTCAARANEPDPAALAYRLPEQIPWTSHSAGQETAVMMGDPDQPGPYILLVKWLPGHMSHPHFHANDRFITVLKGHWWVGTGAKFDPDGTKPIPPGSFVTHFAKQIHYDGAKDEEVILEIVGQGPAASIAAEVK